MVMSTEDLVNWRKRLIPVSELNSQWVWVHRDHVLDLIDEVVVHRETASLTEDLENL